MFGRGKPHTITDSEQIDELLTRGVSEVIDRNSLRKKLCAGTPLRVKLGIDPTSPNLHLGRSVTLLKLRDFQALGHQVVLIIGDGTGVIGDTSDKESERPMLTESQVSENAKTYFRQAGKILDMGKVEKRRNSEWLNKLSYSEIGKHADQFSVADFIARENIKHRIRAGKRVSLREVLYPLMQGYDSVAVRADVEIGGTDQRFNLLAGRKLQERYGQTPQDILTTDLIEGIDGRKMSSSWRNTIDFTDEPSEMYGKVMRVKDEYVYSYFVNTTRVSMGEIEALKKKNPRDVKMRLAREIVTLYHGGEKAKSAEEKFVTTFSEGNAPGDVAEAHISPGALLSEVLFREGIVSSKSEFRRLVSEGAIHNTETGKHIENLEEKITQGAVFKIGKRRFLKVIVRQF